MDSGGVIVRANGGHQPQDYDADDRFPFGEAKIWIPLHVSELDQCTHLLDKFDPDLDEGHPGFTDKDYRKRRCSIAEIAFNYKNGAQIPHVVYTSTEQDTWARAYRRIRALAEARGCSQHMENVERLERASVYSERFVPQLQDVSAFMKRSSGFTLRPVAGLLTSRDFLASLAFRVFQCTQYIRHHSTPEYSPEPDCVHELLGHVPMLLDPEFARFSQEIGLASLGASDDDIKKLAAVYWFTVEFGLCKQDGEVKAYGAGLLSSFGEMENAYSGVAELRPFDAVEAANQEYSDHTYQPVYFVAESFEDMQLKVRTFASSLQRPSDVRYDPCTDSVVKLNSRSRKSTCVEDGNDELSHLCKALGSL